MATIRALLPNREFHVLSKPSCGWRSFGVFHFCKWLRKRNCDQLHFRRKCIDVRWIWWRKLWTTSVREQHSQFKLRCHRKKQLRWNWRLRGVQFVRQSGLRLQFYCDNRYSQRETFAEPFSKQWWPCFHVGSVARISRSRSRFQRSLPCYGFAWPASTARIGLRFGLF